MTYTGRAAIALFLLSSLASVAQAAPAPVPPKSSLAESEFYNNARLLLKVNDHVGFRVFVKKAYSSKITLRRWLWMKHLIELAAPSAGFDLIYLWDFRNQSARSNFDTKMDEADKLMLSGQFGKAFQEYQDLAAHLKKLGGYNLKRKTEASIIYPYVIHNMARALYGAGRFDDSLTVYNWIDARYPRFRQVLFEKMWAAFRVGRVDIALGAVISQKSPYFSHYLSPESYLLQTYIYRRLCREDDLEQVIREMKQFEIDLAKMTFEDWASRDVESKVLLSLSKIDTSQSETMAGVTRAERDREKNLIREGLRKSFETQKPKTQGDLKTATAYARLASSADAATVLKPVTQFPNRSAFLKLNLEIWPADSAEEWADEVGTHLFLGESQCGVKLSQ